MSRPFSGRRRVVTEKALGGGRGPELCAAVCRTGVRDVGLRVAVANARTSDAPPREVRRVRSWPGADPRTPPDLPAGARGVRGGVGGPAGRRLGGGPEVQRLPQPA